MSLRRGKLINPFLVDIAQIDTAAMAAGPGFNKLLNEPRVSYDPITGARDGGRREQIVRLRCQIETDTSERQRQTPGGNAPASAMVLILHFKDLERAGLVDPATNRPTLRVNDRVVQILTLAGAVSQVFPNPPGLYVLEVQPIGFGYGGKVNLLKVTTADRPQAQIR